MVVALYRLESVVSATCAARREIISAFLSLNVTLKCPVNEAHAVKCPCLAGCGERMVFQSCAVVLFCSFVSLFFKDTKLDSKSIEIYR